MAAAIIAVPGHQWQAAIKGNRSIPDEPFRIAGNLYYVGSTGRAEQRFRAELADQR